MRTAIGVIVALLSAASAAAGAGPTTKAVPADPLVDAALAAAEAGQLAAFTPTIEKAAADALAKPESLDLPHLTQLATLREFGAWFGRVKQPSEEQKATLAWLLRQRRLAPALLLSATSFDPPDRALAILTALRKERRDRLERFPELTAAMCLVWDDPDRYGTGPGGGEESRAIDGPRILRIFGEYAENPDATRNASGALGVELLTFLVDNQLSADEIEWVRRQYAAPDVGGAFFEVGYGPSRELTRDAKPEEPQNAYTLANLRKVGGRLADQAYYATQIGKTFGVPTATCTGLVRDGQESQAWVAFLGPRGEWDTTSARYRIHALSPGEVLDPQTLETFPQGELTLIADADRTPPTKRAAARALCKLLDRASAAQQLAVIKRAVELSPSDRRVWQRVAKWGQDWRPGSDEYRAVASLVSSQLMPRSEEAALHVRMVMIEKRTAVDRAAALTELRPAFEPRADLMARIQLARASALREKKDHDAALRELGEVLDAVGAVPAQSVAAMQMVDDILRERSQLDRLADVYDRVWSHMRPPPQSPVAHTTAYWAIGQEYAQLLEELGRKHELEGVREKLAQLWAEPVKR